MTIMNHPRIVMRATTSLTENPDNTRTHSPRQLSALTAAIEQFGWLVPIVCDADLMILAGHARRLVAKKLKLAEEPVVSADHLSEIESRAFALAEMMVQGTARNRRQGNKFMRPSSMVFHRAKALAARRNQRGTRGGRFDALRSRHSGGRHDGYSYRHSARSFRRSLYS